MFRPTLPPREGYVEIEDENGNRVYQKVPSEQDKKLASLEVENKLLKAQNQALAERGEFIEDVIAEMAMDFYA
jgi:hypothetical protein